MPLTEDRLGVFSSCPVRSRLPTNGVAMLDFIYLTAGVALFAAFGVYAALLRRV
jgi:hypothetical protein